MKKLFLLFFALLLFNPIYSQWQSFNVAPSGRFNDVCVVDNNIIWACGDTAKVFRSTNGGSNWILSNSGLPIGPVLEITSIDQNSAWIHTANRIFVTTNGGIVWIEQYYSPVTFINKIHFFNQNTGYLIADQQDSIVGFFVTRNGGTNWVRTANSPILSNISTMWMNDNGSDALDTNFIWFIAKGSPSVYSRFYKLTGGLNNSWQYYNIGSAPGQYSYSTFKNANTGLVTSMNGISITTNGGVNWQLRSNMPFPDITRELMIVPGTDWVIQTGIGNTRISYDMCTSWQPIRPYNYYNFCDAKDTNSIWAAGSNGQLLKYNYGYIGINQISTQVSSNFVLHQNYPNPFNPETNITFELPVPGDFKITIFDVTGREIYSVKNFISAGKYSFIFNADAYSSGVYFYSAEFNNSKEIKKMILLR